MKWYFQGISNWSYIHNAEVKVAYRESKEYDVDAADLNNLWSGYKAKFYVVCMVNLCSRDHSMFQSVLEYQAYILVSVTASKAVSRVHIHIPSHIYNANTGTWMLPDYIIGSLMCLMSSRLHTANFFGQFNAVYFTVKWILWRPVYSPVQCLQMPLNFEE